MSTTIGGIRIVDMPDLGVVTSDSSVVGERAGSGRFSMQALRDYLGGGDATYSIAQFGAMSDGITDDAAAFSAAVAAVLALPTGGKLVIPAGRTVLDSGITAHVPAGKTLVICGTGAGSSEIYCTNQTNALDFELLNSGTDWGSVQLCSFTLTRGPITPPMFCTGIHIWIAGGAMYGGNSLIRDLVIQGSETASQVNQWMNSVILAGISGITLDNVAIYGINSTASDAGDVLLWLTGGPNTNQFGVSYNIVNCVLTGGSCGVQISGWVQGVFINNSTIIGQYDGIRWATTAAYGAEELAVSNCTLNAGHRGFYTSYVNQSSLNNTTILHFNTGASAGFAGVELNHSAFNSIVANNVIGANVGSETGFLVSDCGPSCGNTIVGNVFANLDGPGIYLEGTSSGVTVVGNTANGGSTVLAQASYPNVNLGNTWSGTPSPLNSAQPLVFTDAATGYSRWFVGNDQSTESGSNAGNNFEIVSSTDAGALLGTPLSINRATSQITTQFALNFTNLPDPAANDAAAAAAGVPVGGMYRNGSILMVRVS